MGKRSFLFRELKCLIQLHSMCISVFNKFKYSEVVAKSEI